jgi:hypothetical protein
MFYERKMDDNSNERLSRIINLDKFVIELEQILKDMCLSNNEYKAIESITALSGQSGFSLFDVNSAWHRVYGKPLFDYKIFVSELSELESHLNEEDEITTEEIN